MNYQETLDWLFNQLPMYQNKGAKAYKKDLSNTLLLMEYLGNPEKKINFIHVAGTNGKGSTSHMLASVLQEQGYLTGLYTSPHLIDFRERIKISGVEITESYIIDFVKNHKVFFEKNELSFFEMTVGLAFQYFKDKSVDYVVLETGLGGRLDSTNVVEPLVSVITNIGLDHTQFLGNTLPLIAKEKAGIIKQGVPVVIGEFHEETANIFSQEALEKSAVLYKAYELEGLDFECDLKGVYQLKNIKTACQTLKVLKHQGVGILDSSIRKGLKRVVLNTGLLGRYQIVKESPKVVCDTAHNKEGLSLVMDQLCKESFGVLHIVFGVVSDKDLQTVLPLLPKNAVYYFTKPSVARAMPEHELMEKSKVFNLSGSTFNTVDGAVDQAMEYANKEDVVYVGGSTFVVADFLEKLKNKPLDNKA